MKKRILLIYPPSPNMKELTQNEGAAEFPEVFSVPPHDLMLLASIAEECGYEAKIRDYVQLGNKGNFCTDLLDFHPDYVLAHVQIPTAATDIAFLEQVRRICPNTKIIVKGAYFLTRNINVIYEKPFIDYVILNEAEYALKDILEGIPDEEIRGIVYRKNFNGVMTLPRPIIENLDELPFAARHLIDNQIYKNEYDGKTHSIIEVSRGCPYDCFFCLARLGGVRYRSVDSVIEEIVLCKEKYSITSFSFESDLFDADREWVREFCKRIIKDKIKITWSANLYPSGVSLAFAELLYKAGCRFLYLGVESATQMVLDNLGKGLKLDSIKETVKNLKLAKIGTSCSFINGLPWETNETAQATMDFALELDCDYTDFYLAFPVIGTKYYTLAKELGLFGLPTRPEYAFCYPIIRSLALSKEEIFAWHERMFQKIVLRPKFIIKQLFRDRNFDRFKKCVMDIITIKREQYRRKILNKKSLKLLKQIREKYLKNQKENKKK